MRGLRLKVLATGIATFALAATAAGAGAAAPASSPAGRELSASVAEAKAKPAGLSDGEISRLASYAPTDNYTATWKRADALKVARDATNTTPVIPEGFPVISDKVWQWDTWPLTGLDTKPLTYKGWHVIMSLVAPRDQVTFGDRHWVARIGYYFSKDGAHWTYGGQLIPESAGIGCMEWAGTAIMTGTNTVRQFYTSVGHTRGGSTCRTTPPFDIDQKLAVTQGQIHADDNGVWFTGFRSTKIIARPDGKYYETGDQDVSGADFAFRDPFVFRDPADKKVYAVFEGNTGGVGGVYQCKQRDLGAMPPGSTVPSDSNLYLGNIGLMQATDATLTSWKLLPPLLSANCVNLQTERPHIVIKNGVYHLFTISHYFTYAPGLTGPDGVYGFVGPSLRSDYQPLNGSGLVLGNPVDAPDQNYSHEVLPNLMVQSFIDQVSTPNGKIPGGTLAPTLQLAIDGSNTYLTKVLPYGYIPAG